MIKITVRSVGASRVEVPSARSEEPASCSSLVALLSNQRHAGRGIRGDAGRVEGLPSRTCCNAHLASDPRTDLLTDRGKSSKQKWIAGEFGYTDKKQLWFWDMPRG